MSGKQIGQVTHFYGRISVAIIALTDTIRVGDTVHFLGHSTDFQQEVGSLQIEHAPVEAAGAGQEVAMKVDQRVRPPARVFSISDG